MNAIEKKERPTLLVVDDDVTFVQTLSEAFERRGYHVQMAYNVSDALALAASDPPEFAVVDLRMPGASGLEFIKHMKRLEEYTRIVVLTGYASIATAVEAVKLGAVHYLAKPVDADEIIAAFAHDSGNANIPVSNRPLSINRLEWEHIQKVLRECQGNISETARRLGMHRRTLQRKLAKRPVRT